MAQPGGNPKIDELRARVKADPKSRLFYPLAEELRKDGQLKEAEDVLVSGLATNPSYLSAWVSLGRVLKDLGKTQGAIEALTKALTFDRENIVAARLLAHAYLDAGDKVEAIKKFKLVHALLPNDLEVEAQINQLDRELNPPTFAPMAVSEPIVEEEPSSAPLAAEAEPEKPEAPEPPAPTPTQSDGDLEAPATAAPESSPFMPSDDEHLWQEDVVQAAPQPSGEPSAIAAPETQFSGPVEGGSPFAEDDGSLPFEEESPAPVTDVDDMTATVTMGDLYAQQGYYDSARGIYEKILASHPDASEVRAKLAALPTTPAPGNLARRDLVIRRLQEWLAKVGRREAVGRL